jgi:hypothetical protein
VTITHSPATPFQKAELVTVEVSYGNASSTWYFVTTAIYKVLYVAGSSTTKGDRLNALRLASIHKMDVSFVTDVQAANPTLGTNLATGKDLLIFSSSAAANSNPITDRGFHLLPIPIIDWEQGYCDDLRMHDSGGAGGGASSTTLINVVGAGHPLAAGLPNGNATIATANYTLQQFPKPAAAVEIATDPSVTSRKVLWGLTNGAAVTGGGGYVQPARRVFAGWAGDSGSEWWNANGKALFDAAINWLLPPKLGIAPAGSGSVTISWTGDGLLQESGTMAADSWSDSANQANPQTRSTSGTRFFRVRQ